MVGAPRRQTELLRLVRAAGCCPDALTLRMAVGQCPGNAAQRGEHRSAHKVQLMGLGPQGGDWRPNAVAGVAVTARRVHLRATGRPCECA